MQTEEITPHFYLGGESKRLPQLKHSACCLLTTSQHGTQSGYIGLARAIHIRCTYGIFGKEVARYTVIYGVYIYGFGQSHIDTVIYMGWPEPYIYGFGQLYVYTKQDHLHRLHLFLHLPRSKCCGSRPCLAICAGKSM